jgi:hypothetical protein
LVTKSQNFDLQGTRLLREAAKKANNAENTAVGDAARKFLIISYIRVYGMDILKHGSTEKR